MLFVCVIGRNLVGIGVPFDDTRLGVVGSSLLVSFVSLGSLFSELFASSGRISASVDVKLSMPTSLSSSSEISFSCSFRKFEFFLSGRFFLGGAEISTCATDPTKYLFPNRNLKMYKLGMIFLFDACKLNYFKKRKKFG